MPNRLSFAGEPVVNPALKIREAAGGGPYRSTRIIPTRPKGQKRPADVVGNVIKVAGIHTGNEEDKVIEAPLSPGSPTL